MNTAKCPRVIHVDELTRSRACPYFVISFIILRLFIQHDGAPLRYGVSVLVLGVIVPPGFNLLNRVQAHDGLRSSGWSVQRIRVLVQLLSVGAVGVRVEAAAHQGIRCSFSLADEDVTFQHFYSAGPA